MTESPPPRDAPPALDARARAHRAASSRRAPTESMPSSTFYRNCASSIRRERARRSVGATDARDRSIARGGPPGRFGVFAPRGDREGLDVARGRVGARGRA